MNGARPRAECRVIRVRSWCEYAWAAIGLFVRWDAVVHVSVVASRDGVVWMVVDEVVRTITQGRQMSMQAGKSRGASRSEIRARPGFLLSPELFAFHMQAAFRHPHKFSLFCRLPEAVVPSREKHYHITRNTAYPAVGPFPIIYLLDIGDVHVFA